MCVLTRGEILKEIERGRLRIDPFEPEQIGPASIDLHLGRELRIPAPRREGPVHLRDEEGDPDAHSRLIEIDDHWVLEPGAHALGITRERVCLPPDLCAWIEGRSRIARFGLMVHVTSGFVHPGVANRQVLEMTNVSREPLALHPGLGICQIVLERTEGEAVYRGRYADQAAP